MFAHRDFPTLPWTGGPSGASSPCQRAEGPARRKRWGEGCRHLQRTCGDFKSLVFTYSSNTRNTQTSTKLEEILSFKCLSLRRVAIASPLSLPANRTAEPDSTPPRKPSSLARSLAVGGGARAGLRPSLGEGGVAPDSRLGRELGVSLAESWCACSRSPYFCFRIFYMSVYANLLSCV